MGHFHTGRVEVEVEVEDGGGSSEASRQRSMSDSEVHSEQMRCRGREEEGLVNEASGWNSWIEKRERRSFLKRRTSSEILLSRLRIWRMDFVRWRTGFESCDWEPGSWGNIHAGASSGTRDSAC